MAISDSQKVDLLYKKLAWAVAKTDTNPPKEAYNETNPSPLLIRGDVLWQLSGSIPASIPAATSSLVQVYKDGGGAYSPTVECTELAVTDNRTWSTNLTDWISQEFGATYFVKVYIDTAGSTTPQTTGTSLQAAGLSDDQWFFDYQAGILNFIGANLPTGIATGITGKSIFISGARYIGPRGVTTWSNGLTIGNVVINGNTITGNTGVTFAGNVTTANIILTNNMFWSNGVSALAPTYGNTQVAQYLPTYTGNISAGNVNVTGNVSASYLIGDGSKLTGLPAGFDNSNVANYLPGYGGNISSNNITATGNITSGNVTTTGNTYGNIRADIISPYQTTITVFNSSTAIGLPVGDNSTRPTGVAGYLRYSTSGSAPEYYNGTTWVSINNTVTSQSFSGDGSNVTYTLDQTTNQAGVLVSINGTLQQPGVAYTVSGNQITFSEIPLTTDVIDVRFLGALVNALTNYSNTNVTAYLAGNITTGNITSSGITANGVIRFTNNTNVSTLQITGTATRGGAGYHDFLSVTNQGGGTNPNKNFRINSTGGLEIIDSTYSNNLFTLTDAGVLTIKSTFTPGAYRVGEVIKTTMLYPSDMGISTDVSTTGGNIATYSYTPVSSSSYIIAEFGGRWEVNGSTIDSWWSNLYVASTQVGVGHMNWDGTANGTLGRTGTFWPVQGRYTNSDTGIKAIYAQANRDSSDDSFIMRYNSNFGFWMKITEIGR